MSKEEIKEKIFTLVNEFMMSDEVDEVMRLVNLLEEAE